MSYAKPLGKCEATGKTMYATESDCQQVCDWANKKNESNNNPTRVKPEYCNKCGYWHVAHDKHLIDVPSISEVDSFIDKPREMSIYDMISSLRRNGYMCLSPEDIKALRENIDWIKRILDIGDIV